MVSKELEQVRKDIMKMNPYQAYQEGINWIIEDVEDIINDMILKQKIKYRDCKNLRTIRMKNNNSKNWGMVEAEERITHYNEVKRQIRNKLVGAINKDFAKEKKA